MKRYLLKKQVLVLLLSIITVTLFPQTFVEQTAISLTGVQYSSVAWGDFDNDGFLDILMTGNTGSEVISKVYRNNGDYSFNEQTSISLPGVQYSSVAWGDYDNDGDLDILLTGEGIISKIYHNNGDKTFTEETGISLTGIYFGCVNWGDYDNDGDLDILLSGSFGPGGITKIYYNTGDNKFTEQTSIVLTGTIQNSVASGDYDNDGDQDILMTGQTGAGLTTKIYNNNGNNSFTEQTGIGITPVMNGSVSWSDYDNDGDLDILLTGNNGSGVSGAISKIYRNNNDKSFTEQAGIALKGVYDGSSEWGDYDNDGYPDILLTGYNSSGQPASMIYRNNGDNTFTEQTDITLTGVYSGCAEWGDYDNDGDLDIFLTGNTGSGIISKIYRNETITANVKPVAPDNLRTIIENNTVTFTWDKSLDTETPQNGLSYNIYIYESGDVNYQRPPHAFRQSDSKNGKRLIAEIGNIQWSSSGYTIKDLAPNKVYYWTVQAVDAGLQGSDFSTEESFTMPFYKPVTQAHTVFLTDMQAATQTTVTWTNGGGINRVVFLKATVTGTADPVDNTTYNIGDITPDGWKCVFNGSANSFVLTGLVPYTDYSLHICEYNGEAGYEKYLISSAFQNPVSFNFFLSEQTGISLDGVDNSSAAWGDYDNDGDLDILLTGYQNVASIYRNMGGNTFTRQTTINLTGVYMGSVAWGDYDNDGDLDILLTGNHGDLISKVYRNNSDNSFTEQTGITLTGTQNSSVCWGDYDNDGDLDILLTGLTSSSKPISKIYRNNGDNSFTEQTNIALPGVHYSSVAWGDYDNDKDLDILLTGCTENSGFISRIYSNNSDNTFTEQTGIILIGVRSGSSAWGDYDNDGDPDILLTGYTGSGNISAIYRNNSDNTFTEQSEIELPGVRESSVDWGDYDNDGDLDILLTGQINSGLLISYIYRNNGDNSFTELRDNEITGVFHSSVDWGDYDNDSDLDILLSGGLITGRVAKIYRNEINNSNINPSVPDGLQSYWDDNSIIFKWNKSMDNATPTPAISYNLRIGTTPGGSEIRSGQALPEGKLLSPDNTSLINDTCYFIKLPFNKYYWSVQSVDNGGLASSFAPEEITPEDSIQAKNLAAVIKSGTSILLRWGNGNGIRRALFGRFLSSEERAKPVNGTVYLAEPYFGEGDQIGTTGWYCLYNGKADSAIIYGINEGYSYDLQVVEYIEDGGLPVYFRTIGNGNPGNFSTSVFSEQTGINLTGVMYSSIAWADFDNDGYLDILLTGASDNSNGISKIYQNKGDNTFTEQTGISFGEVRYSSAAWGDYDNDNYLDILITGDIRSSPSIAKIYHNNGDSTFTEQTGIPLTGVNESSVAWGDYDNDGYLDILLTGNSGSGRVSKIYRNNRDNSFTEQTDISLPQVDESSVAWGDYDNDGDLDILLTGNTGSSRISKIYQNNGNNSFTEQTGISLPGVSFGSVDWGDFDNDNDLDILITGYALTEIYSEIYRNNGDNTFTRLTGITLDKMYDGSAIWGDYDNDGDLDILMTGSVSARIYRNNGNSTFTEQTNIPFSKFLNGSAAWGDYDNDGDLDILLTGFSGTNYTSKIYRNNTFMRAGNYLPNQEPAAPANLLATPQPEGIKLNWSPVINDETPYKTMSYNVRIGTAYGKADISPPMADSVNGYRRIVAIGNSQLDTTHLVKNLPSGKYYWSVQAVDQGYAGGAWSAVDSFEVRNVQAFFSVDTVCLGFPTHFTDQSVAADGIESWNWDFRDGSISDLQSPERTYAASGSYNVKLVITSTGGVKDSLEQNIIVKPRPVTGFTAPPVCQGIPSAITNTTDNNGLTITSWYWDFDDGSIYEDQQPPEHGYLSAGDYLVKLRAIAGNGCADSIIKTVSVGNYPAVEITASGPLDFCDGDNVILAVPYNTDYLYTWKINGTSQTNSDSSRFVAKVSGSYTVEVINSKGDCTTTSLAVAVTTQEAPIPPLISDDGLLEFCQGDSVVLSVTYTAGYTYQWKLNGGAVGTNSNQYSAKSSGNYTLTVSNSSGCDIEATNTVNVVVDPIPTVPTVNISGPTTFCQGGSVELSVVNNPLFTYQWENNGSAITGAVTNVYTVLNAGVYSLKISGSGECFSRTDNVTVTTLTAPSAPLISADGPLEFCQVDSVVLSVTYTAGYTYQWKLNGGAVGINSNQHSAKSSGTYSLTVSNSTGCSVNATNTVNVTVNPKPVLPTVNISGLTTFCQGASVELSVTNNPAYTYQWENNGAGITGATTNTYTTQASGVYTLKISNSSGCYTKTENVTVNVLTAPSAPLISTGGALEFCQGDSVILSVTNTSGYSYQWKLNGGAVGTNLNSFTAKSSGDYTLAVTNSSGCIANSTNTITVDINSKPTVPTVSISGQTSFCNGENVVLSVINNPLYTYQWQNNGSNISGATFNTYTAQNSGVYLLNILNSDGCGSNTENVTITVSPSPVAPTISNSGQTQFCQGDSVILSVTNTSGYTYQWKLNGGAVGSHQNSFIAKSSGDYTLTVSNSSGCAANSTNTVNVTVNQKPTLPTVNISGPTTFCQGSSVELSVTNNPANAYQWENNGSAIAGDTTNIYTAQSSGICSLKISNSDGCYIRTENVTVNVLTAPSAPLISASENLEFCQGDSVVLSVTSTAGYTYQWKLNGGAVGNDTSRFAAKNSGTYNLVVSNTNGCSVTSSNSVNVTVNSVPTVSDLSQSGPASFCGGDSVTLSSPSVAGYLYKWRNEYGLITNATTNCYTAKSSGIYQMDVSNASGCSVRTSLVQVTVRPSPYKPVIESANYQSGVCPEEGQIRLNVNQAMPEYHYLWYKDGLPLINDTLSYLELYEQGNYKLEANLNGCIRESDVFNINLPDAPEKPLVYVQGPTVWYLACNNITALEYKWYCNGNLIEGADKYYYVAGRKMGEYRVSVGNSQGCYTSSDIVTIPTGTTGIDDVDPVAGIKIYPNPTTGMFTIEIDNNIFGELIITVITEQGKEILNITFEKTSEYFSGEIDLNSQAKGMYILSLIINKYFIARKLVIE